jgi:hypothetical protein
LPSPGATTRGQTGLASNPYAGYGVNSAPRGNASTGYNTGPYGMASHSAPSGGLASTNGGSPYAGKAASPNPGAVSPYANPAYAQPSGYPAANDYRTADIRSATPSTDYGSTGNAYGGQPVSNAPPQSGYIPHATQNWGAQAPAAYSGAGGTGTTGLNQTAGPFQPGSTLGSLPVNGGGTNLQGGATRTYSGNSAPAAYPQSSGLDSGSYNQPVTPTNNYPATGANLYPSTGGGQGYASPYPGNGY